MELRDYLRLLRKSWLLIVLCAIVAAGLAYVVSARSTKMYSASVTLVVSSPDTSATDASNAYQGNLLSQQRVKSYADLVASDRIAGAVVKALRLPETTGQLRSELSASAVPDTVLLKANVTDRSPTRAATIANSVGQQFSRAVAQIEAPATGKTPNVKVSVWESAKIPTSPVSPKPVRDGALGLVVGLLFGIGLAVLRDRLDTTVRTAADIAAVADLPVLGAIAFDGDTSRRPLVVQAGPHSPRAEAFRQLRTNLRFVDVDTHPRIIVLTSSLPQEGKTTTSCNLAVTMSQAGMRVALVEGDLRRPSFGDYLGIEDAVGLTSVLIGAASLDDALQPWGDGRLQILPSGPVPPNPSELLGSEGMSDLLRELGEQFDMVIVDAPPLLPVTDAAVLGVRADGVLVVARAGKTRREQLRRSVESLRVVDARILGSVLNMIPTRGPDAYSYGYSYRYDSVGPDGRRGGRRRGGKGSRADAPTPILAGAGTGTAERYDDGIPLDVPAEPYPTATGPADGQRTGPMGTSMRGGGAPAAQFAGDPDDVRTSEFAATDYGTAARGAAGYVPEPPTVLPPGEIGRYPGSSQTGRLRVDRSDPLGLAGGTADLRH